MQKDPLVDKSHPAEDKAPGTEAFPPSQEEDRLEDATGEKFLLDDDPNRLEMYQAVEDNVLLGNLDKADLLLEKFKLEFGGGPDYLLLLGRLQKLRGNPAQAYAIFKKLYYEWPLFMADRRDFENLRDELINERHERARAQWNRVLAVTAKHQPKEGEPPPEKGGNGLHDEVRAELEKLVTYYQEILDIEPMHQPSLKGMIHCYGELGREERQANAQVTLREATSFWNEMAAKRAHAVIAAGQDMVKQGKEEGCIKVLNLGLETSPLHHGLLVFKAEILRRLEKFKEAMACVDVLLRENPNDSEALKVKKKIQSERFGELITRGYLLIQEGEEKISGSNVQKAKIKEALECFYDALDFDPNNVKALAGVYRCQVLSNNPLKAKKTLERIKEVDPKFQPGAQASGNSQPAASSTEGNCFVATRLFGRDSEEVRCLREFRDRRLSQWAWGRCFIRFYGRIGPRLAELRPGNPLLPFFRWHIRNVLGCLRRWGS